MHHHDQQYRHESKYCKLVKYGITHITTSKGVISSGLLRYCGHQDNLQYTDNPFSTKTLKPQENYSKLKQKTQGFGKYEEGSTKIDSNKGEYTTS